MTEPLSKEEINALLAGIETTDIKDPVEDKVENHQKVMDEHKRIYEQTGTTAALGSLAKSYEKMGDYLMESKNSNGVEPLSEEEINMLLSIIASGEENLDPPINKEPADSSAPEKSINNSFEDVKSFYQKAVDAREQIYKETGTIESLSDLAAIYKVMGSFLIHFGPDQGASEYCQKAIDARQQIYEQSGTTAALIDLAESFEEMGNISRLENQLLSQDELDQLLTPINTEGRKTGEMKKEKNPDDPFARAREYYKKAIDIRKKIHEHISTVDSLKALAGIYCKYLKLIPEHLKQNSRFQNTETEMKLENETIVFKDGRKFFVMFVQKTDDIFLGILSTIPENNEAIDFSVYEICCSDTDDEGFTMTKYSGNSHDEILTVLMELFVRKQANENISTTAR